MTGQPDDDQPVVELTAEDCWELLAEEEFGRLAFRILDELYLVPINYALDGRSIVFRSAPGTKLFAAELEPDAAFEIDWCGETAAWSVVVRGGLRRLGEDEQARAEGLAVPSWVPTLKYEYLELTPQQVSGRRFLLRR